MKKKVLILCTGNSCRSIIAEALINAQCHNIMAQSSGINASGKVHPYAKILLQEKGIWKDTYCSKTLDTVIDDRYDLVVTVCDHAQEHCPVFPSAVPTIHIGFEDPDGQAFDAFETTYTQIKNRLLPTIKKELS